MNNLGRENYFLEKKKPMRDDHQRLLSRFQGNISAAAVVDHQLEFSHDDGHHSFLPKVGDSHDDDESAENDPQERRIFWESQEFLLQVINLHFLLLYILSFQDFERD